MRKQQIDGPAPSQIVADVPSDLDALALALMRRDPDHRPVDAEILSLLGTAARSAAIDVVPDLFVGRATHLRELDDCSATCAQATPSCAMCLVHRAQGRAR